MPQPPSRPGPAPGARTPAPHVSAAIGRMAQPRMAERAGPPARQPAAHLQAAIRGAAPAAVQRAVQAKPAGHVQAAIQRAAAHPVAQAKPAPAARRPSPARHPLPLAPARPRAVQMMENVEVQLPKNITGMDRDGETVKTAGGTWRALRYVAVKRLDHAPAWGASMTLEFTPEYPVDATSIALVQTVTAFKNADFYYPNETTANRAYAGTAIDQVPASRSPLYADQSGTGNGNLGSSSEQEGAGEHGHRYWDSDQNKWVVKAAWLKDVPHFRGVDSFSKQTFETTAIAVAGKDKGAYFGSVSWGWRRKDDGDVLIDPLAIVSQGSASESFQASVDQWNKTKTSGNHTPQQLPPVAPRKVNQVPVNRNLQNQTFLAIGNDKL